MGICNHVKKRIFALFTKQRAGCPSRGTKAMLHTARRLGRGTALAQLDTNKIEEIQKEISYETEAIIWRNAHFIRVTGWMYGSPGPHHI
jgi:hypothetical protein